MFSKKERILELLNQFKDKKILVIGDIMIDDYVLGKVDRISPEAPVPVVKYQKSEMRLGGAANVALNLKKLGANVSIASVIGNDEMGKSVLNLLNKYEIFNHLIYSSSLRPTTIKRRIIASNHQLLRVDIESDEILDLVKEETPFKNLIFEDIKNYDCILFEDYDKGVLTKNIISEITQVAKLKNIPIAVDPKFRNFNLYKNINLFKPNLKELIEGLNYSTNKNYSIDDISKFAREFANQQNIEQILVTLSERGAIIVSKAENDYRHIPAHFRNISDVSGAGDTVISVAALCLSSNASPIEIVELSNLAGGMVCEKPGVVPLTLQELVEECNNLWN